MTAGDDDAGSPRRARDRAAENTDEALLIARAVLQSQLTAVVVMDRDGRVIEFSSEAERIFGIGRADALGSEFVEAILPERVRQAHRHGMRQLLETGRSDLIETPSELIATRPDGTSVPLALSLSAVGSPDGFVFVALLARDITEDVQARADRDMLSYVVDSSADAILTKSADGTIISWNRGAHRLYGYTAEEAIGQCVADLIVPPELRPEQDEMTRRVFAGETIHREEIERVSKDGSRVLVSLAITPVRDAAGRILSAAIVARDVGERRRYESRLEYLAGHDHLTGLLNRRSFEEELSRELDRAAREGEDGALLSVDLDSFKALNDVAGHAAGDALLTRVARALMANTRASDAVARLGGDEFAVLLPNTGPERARDVAAKLLDALHACSVQVEGTAFRATASIGVAMLAPGLARVDDLIVAADMAMYSAKQSGRDRIAVFTPSDAELARAGARKSWAQRIRQALESDGLVLYRQPIVDLGTGRASHSELLLRMRDGERLIEPALFLEAAERVGLIHAIDRWVVRRAISALARDPPGLRRPVSVNVSGESVAGDGELLQLIRSELQVSGLEPALMIFEITETAAISNISEAQTFADGIRSLGCRIALDDFGTGFGSFLHLKHLPVDYVKIDHEFVHDLVLSELDQRIVSSIVEIATLLGIETVAEAVADEPTARLLRDLGVDYGQGFHLGRPEPMMAPPDAASVGEALR